MKLEFQDTLTRDAIDLTFEIKDEYERDITVNKADIKWSLIMAWSKWGLESFKYELSELRLPIHIETIKEGKEIEKTDLYVEIKFNSKRFIYECRIYEDFLVDGKWEEEEYGIFPIELAVEEKPSSENGNRSQIFVKYIELNLNSNPKRLIISI